MPGLQDTTQATPISQEDTPSSGEYSISLKYAKENISFNTYTREPQNHIEV